MGVLNTNEQRLATLNRVQGMRLTTVVFDDLKFRTISERIYQELRDYFALCAMARGKSEYNKRAERILFSTRVKLENFIRKSIHKTIQNKSTLIDQLIKQKFFGGSSKQGISVRLPLSSCEPSKLCSNLCYAHDVLDASSPAVIRGSINGVIAELYEKDSEKYEPIIKELWSKWIDSAIRLSYLESEGSDFKREPRIRFGHVGDVGAYSKFFNFLAGIIKNRSNGQVKNIVYTRHSLARALDSDLFTINFTLDATSEERVQWVPTDARIVYSAFGGRTSDLASINFLEHHRFKHYDQVGKGNVCPATHPTTKLRTCDAVKCDLCFQKKS